MKQGNRIKQRTLLLYYQARLEMGRLLGWLGLRAMPPVHYIGGSESLPPPLTPEEEAERVRALLSREMEGAVSYAVPLRADAAVGKNWGEAKG